MIYLGYKLTFPPGINGLSHLYICRGVQRGAVSTILPSQLRGWIQSSRCPHLFNHIDKCLHPLIRHPIMQGGLKVKSHLLSSITYPPKAQITRILFKGDVKSFGKTLCTPLNLSFYIISIALPLISTFVL